MKYSMTIQGEVGKTGRWKRRNGGFERYTFTAAHNLSTHIRPKLRERPKKLTFISQSLLNVHETWESVRAEELLWDLFIGLDQSEAIFLVSRF